MGVRVLYDPDSGRACMYDSVTEWAFGPIFFGQISETGARMFGPDGDPQERCESFISFVYAHGSDPRKLTDGVLDRLHSDWAATVTSLASNE